LAEFATEGIFDKKKQSAISTQPSEKPNPLKLTPIWDGCGMTECKPFRILIDGIGGGGGRIAEIAAIARHRRDRKGKNP
jgi:hypothetical protein